MIIHHEKVKCRCQNCDRKTSDVGISMGSEKTRYRFVLYLCDDCAKQILRGLLGLPKLVFLTIMISSVTTCTPMHQYSRIPHSGQGLHRTAGKQLKSLKNCRGRS